MFFCIRWDLDYVPWDSPDAEEFGHGEPAMFLRILELARQRGDRFQFCASNRVLRAFPALGDAVLDDGHDLDWLCKHPEEPGMRWEVAKELFASLGKLPEGMAYRRATSTLPTAPVEIRWTSGGSAEGAISLPLALPPAREVVRSGRSYKAWIEQCLDEIKLRSESPEGITVAIHPQMLARLDAQLSGVKTLLETADSLHLPVISLRQAFARFCERQAQAES